MAVEGLSCSGRLCEESVWLWRLSYVLFSSEPRVEVDGYKSFVTGIFVLIYGPHTATLAGQKGTMGSILYFGGGH